MESLCEWGIEPPGSISYEVSMKVQGRLMQARFIEIHQIFEEKKVGYFSNRVLFTCKNPCYLIGQKCYDVVRIN